MNMWKIVKSDLTYHYKRILLNVLFLAIFSISVILDLEGLDENNPVSNVFWPLLVSIGSVFLAVISYKIGIKEERNRILLLIPLKLKTLAYARLIAGAIQLAGVFAYLLIVHHWLINKWEPVTDRVFYQFGSYTYIISAILFIYYFVRALTKVKIMFKVLLVMIMFLCSFSILFYTDSLIFNTVPHYLSGLIYFLIGMILYLSSGYYFLKQKSYLEKVLLS